MQRLDIDSNYDSIRTLDPFVRDKATSYAEFSTAVHVAVATYLPELAPHAQEILRFLVRYYGVTDERGALPIEDLSQLVEPPPVVVAGESQEVDLPAAAALSATVLHESADAASFAITWSQLEGPGPAVFGDAHALATDVTFPGPGTYVLQVEARGERHSSASDQTVVAVRPIPPRVDAGPAQTIEFGAQATLHATVLDDPADGRARVSWSRREGPGDVVFAEAEALDTVASFAAPGEYVLELQSRAPGRAPASGAVAVTVKARD